MLVFPRFAIASGLADHVLDAVATSAGARCVDTGEAHLATRVAEAMDRLHEWRPGSDPWWDLAHWPALRGQCAAVRSWEDAVGDPVTRWEALTHESGREPRERFRLLVGVGLDDLEGSPLDRTPSLHVSVRWWWGVVDRLDTELYLSGRDPDPLAHAEAVEVTAWALEGSCGGGTDGHALATGLPRAVREHDRTPRTHRQAPPPEIRPHWDLGLVELWDGRYRPVAAADPEGEERRVLRWRAQVRLLFPYLEEHRVRILREFLPKALTVGVAPGFGDVWELGDMFGQGRRVGLSLATYDHLKVARDVRNDLAHGRPAEPRQVELLREKIPL
ncbi:hypothetical protein [Fodinibacter luteus]|uniref:hypothetical protein n=1 Tax=Fodinibacter luteus TaxID=552064 RepID=UPI0031EF881A